MAFPFYSNAAAAPIRGLPADIGTEREILAKKRRILDALMGRGMGRISPTVDAGVYKVANWGDALGSIADAYFGKKGSDELDERERALGEETSKRTQEGITKYLATLLGDPNAPIGQDTRALDESGAEGAPPTAYGAVRANPIKAIAEAMGSGLAPLQDMAKTGLVALTKSKVEGNVDPKSLLQYGKNYDPKALGAFLASVQAGNPDPTLLTGRAEAGVSGDLAYTKQDGQITGTQPIQTYSKPAVDEGTGVPGQFSEQTGRYHGTTGGNVTPATTLGKDINAAAVDQLKAGRTEARDAINGLQAVARGQTIVRQLDPVALGTFSNFRLAMNKAIQGLGGKPLPEGAKVEELNGALGQLLLNQIRKLAPVTKEDIATMERIIGSSGNTRAGLEGMLDYAAKVFARTIDAQERLVADVSKQPGGEAARVFGPGEFTVSGAGGFGQGENSGGRQDPLDLFGGK